MLLIFAVISMIIKVPQVATFQPGTSAIAAAFAAPAVAWRSFPGALRLGNSQFLRVGVCSMGPYFVHGTGWVYKDSRLGVHIRTAQGRSCRPATPSHPYGPSQFLTDLVGQSYFPIEYGSLNDAGACTAKQVLAAQRWFKS